jgi:hypothetical protein
LELGRCFVGLGDGAAAFEERVGSTESSSCISDFALLAQLGSGLLLVWACTLQCSPQWVLVCLGRPMCGGGGPAVQLDELTARRAGLAPAGSGGGARAGGSGLAWAARLQRGWWRHALQGLLPEN